MEPAVYRREHRFRTCGTGCPAHVAMEPAVYRREHVHGPRVGRLPPCPSQWSPPFIGGSTNSIAAILACEGTSQWSPPFIGGSTRWYLVFRRCGVRSQWSPPFIGGSTRETAALLDKV